MIEKNRVPNEEEVIWSISDSERRERLKASMVRLGNDIEHDKEGLMLLSARTKELIGKELWRTWSFIMGNMPTQRRKPVVRVLVVGDAREDVEEFLKAATNSSSPNGEVKLSISHPLAVPAYRDASLPSRDHDSGKEVAAAAPSLDIDYMDSGTARGGGAGLQSDVAAADNSAPLESQNIPDQYIEQLQIAVWETAESRIAFHQPLNINPLLDMSHDQNEPAAIHPFDGQSPIRAKLNLDCPAHAMCVATWREWLRDDGIHICLLILSSSDMYTRTEAGLQRFLHRYYGLHDISTSQYSRKVAACSPVPLLILHS